MTRLSVTVGLVVLFLSVCGCERKPEKPEATPAASTPVPPPAPSARALLPEAKEAGEKIAQGSPKYCADQKCRFAQCNKLCAAWVSENYATLPRPAQKNRLFFGCMGACLAALGDGGAP
jgi:hypothetical protein